MGVGFVLQKDSSYKGDWVAFVWRELIDISSCEEEEDDNIDTKGGDGVDRDNSENENENESDAADVHGINTAKESVNDEDGLLLEDNDVDH